MGNQLGIAKEAKVVVGLDIGTTFSGFAYALRADPDKVYSFYDWPMQAEGGGLPYCKTPTTLLYSDAGQGALELQEWGWPALVKFKSSTNASTAEAHILDAITTTGRSTASRARRLQSPNADYLVTLFKAHLTPKDSSSLATGSTSAPALPPGMTATEAISDFLSQISKLILKELRNSFGSHISLDNVEWCLTVPANWDERAKDEMRNCSEIAGLVQGPQSKGIGSPHPLKLFIEPEAASIYCQLKLKDQGWRKGDKFLVVDCGGGTVDIVLHEKLGAAPSVSVREVQGSSGAVCGGSLVDEEFFRFLRRRICCFTSFERQYPAIALAFRQDWERIKCDYAGENRYVHVKLPPQLASMWEEEDAAVSSGLRNTGYYDKLKLSTRDMKSIFDPVVDRILELIKERIVPDLHAIMVVGGFSASPYLMRRIRETFSGRVRAIASPPCPGSAICCGAVTMGIRSDIVVSRISKKTYGIKVVVPFRNGVHPVSSVVNCDSDPGKRYSNVGFSRHVLKGDKVRLDECVKAMHCPIKKEQKRICIEFYSSDSEHAMYITDPGMRKEGSFTMECPSFNELGTWPCIEVAMCFGRTEIQVTAVGKNFDSERKEMLPVKFERDSIIYLKLDSAEARWSSRGEK